MTALPPDQLHAIQAILAQQAPAQAEQIAQSIAVTVQSSPINVNALARALVIDGTATQTNAIDQLLLRTGQGDFLVKIPAAALQQLQDNLPSRVTLQLRPGPNGLEAVLVVGSRAAQQADQVQQSLASNAALSRQTLTSEIPKIGQVFQVTVLPSTLLSNLLYNQNRATAQKLVQNPAAPQTPQPATGLPPQTTADPLSGGVKQQQSASPAPANPAPVQTNQNPINNLNEGTASSRNNYEQNSTQGNPQQSQQKLPSPTGDQAVKIPLPINQTDRPQLLPIRILNVTTAQSEVPIAPIDKSLVATVRGATPSGQPILTIDDQVVVVNANKNWPIGTKLQLSIGAGVELVTEKEPKGAPSVFQSLQQILEVLGQQNPVLINEVKRFRIAQGTTGQVAGPLLFFLSALKKGNLDTWLGHDVKEALELSGKHSLLAALKDEIEGGRAGAVDNMGTSWKGTTVPYLDGDKLQQFRFYVHQDNRQPKPGQSERDLARRFLIDVSLTRLGPIQIDGLVNQKKLDLIVRTVNGLPEDLRNDLRVRFAHAMEEVRYTGSLIFQTSKQGWVELKTRQGQTLSKNL